MFTILSIMQMFVLCGLGVLALHRLILLKRYYRVRGWRASRVQQNQLAAAAFQPFVTVQLPIYNEPAVIGRLLDAVAALRYPRELLEVQILDDSNDGTSLLIQNRLAALRRSGLNVVHLQRGNRTEYKAGALQHGLQCARGTLIAVFDADFIPPPHFLERSVPYFMNPRIAMVQARWTFLNRTLNMLTRGQSMLLHGHFQIEHLTRFREGLFFNFNGTGGIWRARAIKDAGGWSGDTLTEDLDLSYRAQLRGWRFVYLRELAVPSELPPHMSAFKTQQARWTTGAIQVLCKLAPRILTARLPLRVKVEALFHLGNNFCYPLLLLAALFTPMLAFISPQTYQLQNGSSFMSYELHTVYAGLHFLCSLGLLGVLGFYMRAEYDSLKEVSSVSVLSALPAALLTGIGLAATNTLAVVRGLLPAQREFIRTPKVGTMTRSPFSSPISVNRFSIIADALLAVYTGAGLVYSILHSVHHYSIFLALFFCAFSSHWLLQLAPLTFRHLYRSRPRPAAVGSSAL